MTTKRARPAEPTGAAAPADPLPPAARVTPPRIGQPAPRRRTLRVFAFDPQASLSIDTAVLNDAVIDLPWEESWEDPLAVGPVNEYVEVVDYDEASGRFYAPVDLTDPMLLAQDGLPPSDGNPQFHQQMVFAVVMRTIRTFERALGRVVLWQRELPASRRGPGKASREYVRRLRIYPHAMREENAYYSPQKAALLFGYFRGRAARDGTGAGSWVFTALSQDIIAHEATHAILHGMFPRSIEASNPDSLAFHEALSDIVALFQHFAVPHVVEQEMATSGGSLRSTKLVGGLAQQFGTAIGREGPLRLALDMVLKEQEAVERGDRLEPDRHADVRAPHTRGQILVAAVYDAFVTIFDRRTSDLLRIAGRKRGEAWNMPPDLVRRLAVEAAKSAEHVLRICIRGLDYLPPVDITFGEYLRAIVTADADLVPDDPLHYRTAFAEAFRKRGIQVQGNSFTTTDSLIWDSHASREGVAGWLDSAQTSFADVLPHLIQNVIWNFDAVKPLPNTRPRTHARLEALKREAYAGAKSYDLPERDLQARARASTVIAPRRNLRDLSMLIVQYNAVVLHEWLTWPEPTDSLWEELLGVQLPEGKAERTQPRKARLASIFHDKDGDPVVEVHSVRVSRRQGPDGQSLATMVMQVLQRRRGYLDEAEQQAADSGAMDDKSRRWIEPDFWFRGGATIIVDLNDGRIRRVIRKDVASNNRLRRQRAFLTGQPEQLTFTRQPAGLGEPFALLHRNG